MLDYIKPILSTIPEFHQIIAMAFFIGLLLELQRLHSKDKPSETFPFLLITILNAVGGYMGKEMNMLFISIGSLTITGLFAIFWFLRGGKNKSDKKGCFEDSISLFFMGLIGLILGYGFINYGLMMGIFLPSILMLKKRLHLMRFEKSSDFIGALKFLSIGFILLPILPNHAIDPWGVINPFQLVLFLTVVVGIQFLSFIGIKMWGGKAILGIATLVGFFDSDVINGSMSSISKKNPETVDICANSVIMGNTSMLVRNMVIVGGMSSSSILFLGPSLGAMGLMAIIVVFLSQKRKNSLSKEKANFNLESPFSFSDGARFVTATVVISIISVLIKGIFPEGIYLVALAGALVTDVSVTASSVFLALSGEITLMQMAGMIMVNSIVSSLNDGMLQYLSGAPQLAKKFLWKTTPIVLVGLSVFIFQFFIL